MIYTLLSLVLCVLTLPMAEDATEGILVLDQVYNGQDVRIYYDDLSLCVDTPKGKIVIWTAPEPQPAQLDSQSLAMVKLQIAMSSLYSHEGMPRHPGESQRLQAEVNTLAEIDSILPYESIYKVYFSADDGIPTYWESFFRGPFPEEYIDKPETFVPSVEKMREGIQNQMEFYIKSITAHLNENRIVLLWPRERRPGMQVIDEHHSDALREIYQIMRGELVETKYLHPEAAEALRRW